MARCLCPVFPAFRVRRENGAFGSISRLIDQGGWYHVNCNHHVDWLDWKGHAEGY